MTFEKLAELVAADFQKTMDEEGFATFNEMRRCYDWEIQDIKEDVRLYINRVLSEQYEGFFYMTDDCAYIVIDDEMSWGNFKKLIFSHLK